MKTEVAECVHQYIRKLEFISEDHTAGVKAVFVCVKCGEIYSKNTVG